MAACIQAGCLLCLVKPNTIDGGKWDLKTTSNDEVEGAKCAGLIDLLLVM